MPIALTVRRGITESRLLASMSRGLCELEHRSSHSRILGNARLQADQDVLEGYKVLDEYASIFCAS